VIRPVSITMAFVVFCVTQLCNPYSNNPADCRATGADNGLSCAPCLPRATHTPAPLSTLPNLSPPCVHNFAVAHSELNWNCVLDTPHRQLMVYNEESSDSTGKKLGGSVLNALMLVVAFIVVTFGMYLLYRFRCTKIIWGYLGFSVGTLLAVFGYLWVIQVIEKYSIVVDYVTLGIGAPPHKSSQPELSVSPSRVAMTLRRGAG
jgi:hypothetical protein